MGIAMGSANKLSYHPILARDLGYLPPDRFEHLSSEAEEIKRMLASFVSRLRPNKNQKLIADSSKVTP